MKKRYSLLLTLWAVLLGNVMPLSAKRIISLAPSVTKNIQYLDDEAELVGCTSYCKTTRPVTVVASAIKVNVEKLVSLKPDIVLATTLTSAETLSLLKKLGVKVVVYPMPHSYQEICTQFAEMGKLLGKEEQARKVLAAVAKKVDALKAKKTERRKIFIELGVNPLYAVINNTFMDDYIRFTGADNIASTLKSGNITREAVLARNPDVIFITTMGSIEKEEKKQWERYANLAAVRNRKIFIIDSYKACIPTPVTFAETLETIYNYLK